MGKELGRLQRVELRDVWLKEDADFTPWLAQPENLAILAETINMELELEAQEKNVGPFRADILCRDVDTESWVLIENQLEPTDHKHLGQLLTYAAGLQAVSIIWVAEKFVDEHRGALDWLNEITDSSFRFFGLEVELFRIGDSQPAPRFNVVSKPNDWTRSVGRAVRQIDEGDLSETKERHLRYWRALCEKINAGPTGIKTRTARPQHWTTFNIGRAGFHLAAKVNTQTNRIGAELFIQNDDAKSYFEILERDKAAIENDIGANLSWEELPARKGSRIAIYRDDVDPTDEADWPRQHDWIIENLEKLDRTFRPLVRGLDASDFNDEEGAY